MKNVYGRIRTMERLPRDSGSLKAFLAMFLILSAAVSIPAHATAPAPTVIAPPCSGCMTAGALLKQLSTFIIQWDGAVPPGYSGTLTAGYTDVIIVSTAVPLTISATYAVNYRYPHGIQMEYVTFSSLNGLTDQSAYNNDNRMFARAADVPPITLPSNLSPSDVPDLVSAAVLNVMNQQGLPGLGIPHNITSLGSFVYANFYDTQTGKTYQVFNGDTITVVFEDTAHKGWTEQIVVNVATTGSIASFQVKPNTLRDAQGNDPTRTPFAGGGGPSVNGSGPSWTPVITLLPGGPYDPPGTVLVGELQPPDPSGAAPNPYKFDNSGGS